MLIFLIVPFVYISHAFLVNVEYVSVLIPVSVETSSGACVVCADLHSGWLSLPCVSWFWWWAHCFIFTSGSFADEIWRDFPLENFCFCFFQKLKDYFILKGLAQCRSLWFFFFQQVCPVKDTVVLKHWGVFKFIHKTQSVHLF